MTQKNSPTILFVGGIAGVVATTVLASKATMKLEGVLDEAEETRKAVNEMQHPSYSEDDRKRDGVLLMAKTAGKVVRLYSPAIVVGAASIAALTGSHVVLKNRYSGVVAAYSVLDKGFKDYRSRVVEELGEDKDLEFYHGSETITEKLKGADGDNTVERKVAKQDVPSVYARFFDEMSKNWSREPEYNRVFLSCQQNYANDLLRTRGHLFLNEVYDMLGISRTKAGAVVGWAISKEGDNFVDFGVFNHENPTTRMFVNGAEGSILLDFNVDGVIYDLLE
ncbi:MAG: DUF6353 family protein [Actinobacteria bacterium]|nr:DUF6353 family protein [Actinomycetota bacterium]